MIINPRGTNGSGKSTLARMFLTENDPIVVLAEQEIHSPTKKDPNRMKTMQVVGRVGKGDTVVLGTYRNNCGGCDEFSWKGSHDAMCQGIIAAARQHEHVVFEGITVSSVYNRYVNLAKRAKAETGQSTLWVLLSPDLEECLRRVSARSGRTVDDRMRENVGMKHRVVESFDQKLREEYEQGRFSLEELDWVSPWRQGQDPVEFLQNRMSFSGVVL